MSRMSVLEHDVLVDCSMSDHGVWRFHALLRGDGAEYRRQAAGLGTVIADVEWVDDLGMRHLYLAYRPSEAVYPAHVAWMYGDGLDALTDAVGRAARWFHHRTGTWPDCGAADEEVLSEPLTVDIAESAQARPLARVSLNPADWMATRAVCVWRAG